LAIALGELGWRVVLVDADFGLANLDLLCGLSPRRDLGDVLSEGRPLSEAVVPGPAGIRIVAGAHGMRTLAEALEDGPDRLVAELAALEAGTDFLVIDAGSGLGTAVTTLVPSADQVVVVTTPEPTAVADAHAAIRHLRRAADSGVRLRVLVNQARSAGEAGDVLARLTASSREFLGVVVSPLGYVRSDPRVPLAVRRRQPFLLCGPSAAARCLRRLAQTLADERRPPSPRPGFFASLVTRRALHRVAPWPPCTAADPAACGPGALHRVMARLE
jgi:flagellar biosynthesis protein FlhG